MSDIVDKNLRETFEILAIIDSSLALGIPENIVGDLLEVLAEDHHIRVAEDQFAEAGPAITDRIQ